MWLLWFCGERAKRAAVRRGEEMYRWWSRGRAVMASMQLQLGLGLERQRQRQRESVSVFVFRRWFSRERAENVRKINPRVSPTDASSIARNLYNILKPHSPFSVSTAWLRAQESGVSGLSSKTHMKLMLKWMRGRRMLKLHCDHVGSSKKFLLSTLPDSQNPNANANANAKHKKNTQTRPPKSPSKGNNITK